MKRATRTDGNTLRVDEVVQGVLDEFRKVIGEVLVADVVQIVSVFFHNISHDHIAHRE